MSFARSFSRLLLGCRFELERQELHDRLKHKREEMEARLRARRRRGRTFSAYADSTAGLDEEDLSDTETIATIASVEDDAEV